MNKKLKLNYPFYIKLFCLNFDRKLKKVILILKIGFNSCNHNTMLVCLLKIKIIYTQNKTYL